VLDAAGKPWVLIETVGVGQVEIGVAGEADTTLVVVKPGWGDAVQGQAGLLEIARPVRGQQADRDGRPRQAGLEFMLDLSLESDGVRVVKTVASKGEGFEELWEAILSQPGLLESDGPLAARRR